MTIQSPTIGLAIIARDEARNLPVLLASIDGAFDRVVLMDTGSKDDTVDVFIAWAKRQTGATFSVGKLAWTGDFSEARTAADQLLMYGTGKLAAIEDRPPMVDWTCWADCDDKIINAERLRGIAAQAPAEAAGLIFGYDYAQHPHTGVCVCHLQRERLVRAGAGTWVGRVHEAQVLAGPVQHVPDDVCHWHHRKQELPETVGRSNVRNLRILRQWAKDEPENPRVLGYLGVENAIRGNHRTAIGFYRRYLKLRTTWDQERAQICRRLAGSLIAMERWEEAETAGLRAIAVLPSWPDSYLTLAEVALAAGDSEKVLFHARRALELGMPESLLILNPCDYTVHPHRLMAAAFGTLGRYDEALDAAEKVLAVEPGDQNMVAHYQGWAVDRLRDKTAQTVVLMAEQLIAHDEQLKARTLLEDAVPSFATDHPDVVALRSTIRERLLWTRTPDDFAEHYETGGSKPEDFLDDDTFPKVCESLPRVSFLLQGLREQLAA